MGFFRTYSWKIAGVVLVLYSLVAGLLVPLKPGILQVTPGSVTTDSLLQLDIEGYNTRFQADQHNQVWLKLSDEFVIKADTVIVLDRNHIRASIHIPPYLPVPEMTVDCSLIVDNPVDGAFVKPSSVFIRATDKNLEMGYAYWRKDGITGLHKADFLGYPFRGILEETIRNTYYHVPMWFGMIFLFLFSPQLPSPLESSS